MGIIVNRNLDALAKERTTVGEYHAANITRRIDPSGPSVNVLTRIGRTSQVLSIVGLAPLPLVFVNAVAALADNIAAELDIRHFGTKRLYGTLVIDIVFQIFIYQHLKVVGIYRRTNAVGNTCPIIGSLS